MELWDFDGEEYQKWKFIHVGEGYYRISPNTVPDSAYVCIAVAEGKETSSQSGYIICMRDNTIQNTSNEASAVQQTVCVPTLTQNDIDNAYKQAALELQATNCTYSVINQSSKKIYNMETNKYYCCVTTVYNTASKAYGCFTSLYEIYCS